MKIKLAMIGLITTVALSTGAIGIKAYEEEQDQKYDVKYEESRTNAEESKGYNISYQTNESEEDVVETPAPTNQNNTMNVPAPSTYNCPQGYADCEGYRENCSGNGNGMGSQGQGGGRNMQGQRNGNGSRGNCR